MALCLTVRDERGVSLASPGGCCLGAPLEQLLSRISFQGWGTRGTLRAGAVSWLSGICLCHWLWGQARWGLFSQRLLLLQSSIHQQEMLLVKLGYKDAGWQEHAASQGTFPPCWPQACPLCSWKPFGHVHSSPLKEE